MNNPIIQDGSFVIYEDEYNNALQALEQGTNIASSAIDNHIKVQALGVAGDTSFLESLKTLSGVDLTDRQKEILAAASKNSILKSASPSLGKLADGLLILSTNHHQTRFQ